MAIAVASSTRAGRILRRLPRTNREGEVGVEGPKAQQWALRRVESTPVITARTAACPDVLGGRSGRAASVTGEQPRGCATDVGEAAPVEGGYRGAALNLAARLCGLAAQDKGGSKTVKTLTWDQVNGWRLARQGLAPRAGFMEAVRRMIGVQAQVMSAAELALWARVDGLCPADVQAALWQERTLVKTWAMRGTLHLFAAEDLPLVVAARNIKEYRYWIKYFESYGISEPHYQTFLEAVPQVLRGEPMTREQLAVTAAKHTGIDRLLPALIESSWGSALKPSAFRGDLCFGPTQGRNVAFVRPSDWLGSWREIDPSVALQEVIRRYLSVYGPATPHDFSRWWGGVTLLAKKTFNELGDELEPVDVEGCKAFALRSALEPMESLSAAGIVRLLPLFDAYTYGLLDYDPLLPSAFKRLVFRPQGWISAVVLVDGRIGGVWVYKIKTSSTVVTVRMFASPTGRVREAIVAEAERLNDFLNTKVVVEFETD